MHMNGASCSNMPFGDDRRCCYCPSRTTKASQTCAAVWVEAALGSVHAIYHCHLSPRCQQQFLGFEIDWAQGMLWVPQSKLASLRNAVQQARERCAGTALKSGLGLLASCAPAMKLTPMLGRCQWLRLGANDVRVRLGNQMLRRWRRLCPTCLVSTASPCGARRQYWRSTLRPPCSERSTS